MRIVAGERKGMRLKTLKGDETRPTSEKVKSAIFSRIGPYFPSFVRVAEMFGGSGNLSLESLSRGATYAYIFEKNPKAMRVIEENITKCRYEQKVTTFKTDARHSARLVQKYGEPVSVLFVDPPYDAIEYYDFIHDWIKRETLTKDAIIVCEHAKSVELPEAYGSYVCKKRSVYGSSAVSIYKGE